jgi:hypothetical protein
VQFPVHPPVHVPAHVPPLAPVEHVPVQVPEHVPWHWTDGAVPGTASHSPVQLAEHAPWQATEGAVAVASHDPEHEPEQPPESPPSVQLAATEGGVQLPLALQLASQLASALTLTWQPPPEMFSPQETLADADAPPSSLPPAVPFRTAVMPAEAALHAAVTWASIPLPPPSSAPAAGMVAWVTPAAERAFAMLVHDVRTAVSMLVWTVWSDVTAEANALAVASPLHPPPIPPGRPGVELHPFARTGTAINERTTAADFQALILAIRSAP